MKSCAFRPRCSLVSFAIVATTVNMLFLGHVLLVGRLTAIAYGSPQKREVVISKRGLWDQIPSKASSVITDFDLQPLSSTSLLATWQATYQEGSIYFEVCSLDPYDRRCSRYSADAKSLEYTIDNLKPEAQYQVHARYEIVVKGAYYKWESSRTVKMPPPGWVSAASSPAFSGLLVLTSLLYLIAT